MSQSLVNRGARKTPNNSGENTTENTVTNKSKRKAKKKKVVAGYVTFLRDYYAAIASVLLMYTYAMYAYMDDSYYRGFTELSYKSTETGKYFHGFEDWKMIEL